MNNLRIIETTLTQASDWLVQISFPILASLITASLIFYIKKYLISKK